MNSRLSMLDAVCWIMDRPVRPLDFTIILHSTAMPETERLRAAARSTRSQYPVTQSRTDGRRWIPLREPIEEVETVATSSDISVLQALQEFVDRPFDLRVQAPVRQLLIPGASHSVLATRFHHAAADGASASMWLTHQLRAAHEDGPVSAAVSFGDPPLRDGTLDGRRSAVVDRPSAAMWRRQPRPSRTRRWHTIEFSGTELRRCSKFTYNAVLTTMALEVLVRWNRMHGDDKRVGLWLPVNIRRAGASQFGNGTSRIRVHAGQDDTPFMAKCRRLHTEISRSMRRREWAVPADHRLTGLPRWLMLPLLRSYLGRPWADVGTATFSHLEQWKLTPREFFDRVQRIECIGPLHGRHCLTIAGVSDGDRTWLTFAYDPAQLTSSDVEELATMYLDQTALAQREISCAA